MNITYYTPSNMAFANFDRAKPMQLAEFIDDVTQNLHNSKQTDVLIMDFSKVFHKVSHNLLMHKLKHYGIRGKINNCIEGNGSIIFWIILWTFLVNRSNMGRFSV
jgi:hypothetical protein